jgi:hypothetical protein
MFDQRDVERGASEQGRGDESKNSNGHGGLLKFQFEEMRNPMPTRLPKRSVDAVAGKNPLSSGRRSYRPATLFPARTICSSVRQVSTTACDGWKDRSIGLKRILA